MMTPLHTWAIAGAIGGAVLPLAIHLLTRPRGERRALPTFRFLTDGANLSLRRNKLRALLVLLARTAAIVLFALGFARFVERSGQPGGRTAAPRRVVILDCSLSMNAGRGGVSLFERARGVAQQKLQPGEISEGELILAAKKARPIFGKTSANLTALRDEVSKARVLPQQLDASAALEAAARTFAGFSEEDLKDCEVCIITDLQRSNWSKANFTPVPKSVPVRFLNVQDGELANAAILDAGIQGLPEAGAPFEAFADVANFGPAAEMELSLNFDGRSWVRKLKLDAQGSQRVTIELTGVSAGWRTGAFQLSFSSAYADALAEDNTFPICVHVRDVRRIALFTRERLTQKGGPAYYLERGLTASPEATVKVSRFAPSQLEGELDESVSSSDILVLANTGRLTDSEAASLGRALSSGQRVLWALQENLDADNIKALEAALGSALRLPVEFIPLKNNAGGGSVLTPIVSARGSERDGGGGRFLVSVNTDRKPFQVFGDSMARLSQTLKLTGGLGSTPRSEAAGRDDAVLAKFSDGSAALIVCNAGAGRLAIVNMPIGASGGNGPGLALHPIFVPLLQEICVDLLSADSAQNAPRVECGAPLNLPIPKPHGPLPPGKKEHTLQLVDAGGKVVSTDASKTEADADADGPRLKSDAAGNALLWPAAGNPGAYLVECDGAPVAGFTVIAPFKEESDLAALSADVIATRLAQDRTLSVVTANPGAEFDAGDKENFDIYFGLALGFLMLELLVLKVFKS